MDEFNFFIESLRDKLNRPLPGVDAQLKMAPITRVHLMKQKVDIGKARKAAVLILLYPDDSLIKTVLIQRQDYNGIHSNQVSFPGGQYEDRDDSMQHTAIRETCEEIGVKQEKINTLGNLTELYIPPSNFLVLPVIGFVKNTPEFEPDIQEVKKVITVPMDVLTDDKTVEDQVIEASYRERVNVPCYMVDGHIIWGATAMIISELVALIKA